MSMCDSLIRKMVRSMATTKKSPTPTATVKISTMSGTAGTWVAKTFRSGSAMVMTVPIKRPIPMIKRRFLERVS